jgi:FtsH-binding integral membrane protein
MATDPRSIPNGSQKAEIYASRPGYMRLLLWVFANAIIGMLFYMFSAHMSDFAIGLVLLMAVFVIWYDRDFPKRTSPRHVTLLFWLPVILGLFCCIAWKITGADIWVRLGITLICVRAANRIIIDRVIRSSLPFIY